MGGDTLFDVSKATTATGIVRFVGEVQNLNGVAFGVQVNGVVHGLMGKDVFSNQIEAEAKAIELVQAKIVRLEKQLGKAKRDLANKLVGNFLIRNVGYDDL